MGWNLLGGLMPPEVDTAEERERRHSRDSGAEEGFEVLDNENQEISYDKDLSLENAILANFPDGCDKSFIVESKDEDSYDIIPKNLTFTEIKNVLNQASELEKIIKNIEDYEGRSITLDNANLRSFCEQQLSLDLQNNQHIYSSILSRCNFDQENYEYAYAVKELVLLAIAANDKLVEKYQNTLFAEENLNLLPLLVGGKKYVEVFIEKFHGIYDKLKNQTIQLDESNKIGFFSAIALRKEQELLDAVFVEYVLRDFEQVLKTSKPDRLYGVLETASLVKNEKFIAIVLNAFENEPTKKDLLKESFVTLLETAISQEHISVIEYLCKWYINNKGSTSYDIYEQAFADDKVIKMLNQQILKKIEARNNKKIYDLVLKTALDAGNITFIERLCKECAKCSNDVIVYLNQKLKGNELDNISIRQVIRNILENAIRYSTDQEDYSLVKEICYLCAESDEINVIFQEECEIFKSNIKKRIKDLEKQEKLLQSKALREYNYNYLPSAVNGLAQVIHAGYDIYTEDQKCQENPILNRLMHIRNILQFSIDVQGYSPHERQGLWDRMYSTPGTFMVRKKSDNIADRSATPAIKSDVLSENSESKSTQPQESIINKVEITANSQEAFVEGSEGSEPAKLGSDDFAKSSPSIEVTDNEAGTPIPLVPEMVGFEAAASTSEMSSVTTEGAEAEPDNINNKKEEQANHLIAHEDTQFQAAIDEQQLANSQRADYSNTTESSVIQPPRNVGERMNNAEQEAEGVQGRAVQVVKYGICALALASVSRWLFAAEQQTSLSQVGDNSAVNLPFTHHIPVSPQAVLESEVNEGRKTFKNARKSAKNNFGISKGHPEPQWYKDSRKSETSEVSDAEISVATLNKKVLEETTSNNYRRGKMPKNIKTIEKESSNAVDRIDLPGLIHSLKELEVSTYEPTVQKLLSQANDKITNLEEGKQKEALEQIIVSLKNELKHAATALPVDNNVEAAASSQDAPLVESKESSPSLSSDDGDFSKIESGNSARTSSDSPSFEVIDNEIVSEMAEPETMPSMVTERAEAELGNTNDMSFSFLGPAGDNYHSLEDSTLVDTQVPEGQMANEDTQATGAASVFVVAAGLGVAAAGIYRRAAKPSPDVTEEHIPEDQNSFESNRNSDQRRDVPPADNTNVSSALSIDGDEEEQQSAERETANENTQPKSMINGQNGNESDSLQNTKHSKWPTVATWMFAITGMLAITAAPAAYFALGTSLLVAGVAAGIGAFCIVAAIAVHYYNKSPSDSLAEPSAEAVVNNVVGQPS